MAADLRTCLRRHWRNASNIRKSRELRRVRRLVLRKVGKRKPEQIARLRIGKELDVLERARDRRRLAARLVDRVARLVQLLLRAGKDVAEFSELRAHRGKR